MAVIKGACSIGEYPTTKKKREPLTEVVPVIPNEPKTTTSTTIKKNTKNYSCGSTVGCSITPKVRTTMCSIIGSYIKKPVNNTHVCSVIKDTEVPISEPVVINIPPDPKPIEIEKTRTVVRQILLPTEYETIVAGVVPLTGNSEFIVGDDGEKYSKYIYTIEDYFEIDIKDLEIETPSVSTYYINPSHDSQNDSFPYIEIELKKEKIPEIPTQTLDILDVDDAELTERNTIQNKFKNENSYFINSKDRSIIKGDLAKKNFLFNKKKHSFYSLLESELQKSNNLITAISSFANEDTLLEGLEIINGRKCVIESDSHILKESIKALDYTYLKHPYDVISSLKCDMETYDNSVANTDILSNEKYRFNDNRDFLERLSQYHIFPMQKDYEKELSAEFNMSKESDNPKYTGLSNIDLKYKPVFRQNKQTYFPEVSDVIEKFAVLFVKYLETGSDFYKSFFNKSNSEYKYYNKVSQAVENKTYDIYDDATEKAVFINTITSEYDIKDNILAKLIIPDNIEKMEVM